MIDTKYVFCFYVNIKEIENKKQIIKKKIKRSLSAAKPFGQNSQNAMTDIKALPD